MVGDANNSQSRIKRAQKSKNIKKIDSVWRENPSFNDHRMEFALVMLSSYQKRI